jgi:hypothetical protein
VKGDKFVVPNTLGIWRMKQREGPPICYIVHLIDDSLKRSSTQAFLDAKSAIKYIGWSKTTPTGVAIREWFEQFSEADATAVAKPLDNYHQQILAEGFGPESHGDAEEPESDPVADTKMVT